MYEWVVSYIFTELGEDDYKVKAAMIESSAKPEKRKFYLPFHAVLTFRESKHDKKLVDVWIDAIDEVFTIKYDIIEFEQKFLEAQELEIKDGKVKQKYES